MKQRRTCVLSEKKPKTCFPQRINSHCESNYVIVTFSSSMNQQLQLIRIVISNDEIDDLFFHTSYLLVFSLSEYETVLLQFKLGVTSNWNVFCERNYDFCLTLELRSSRF